MKHPFEKHLSELGTHESLTESERARMRSTLLEYARMKPVRAIGKPQRIILNTFLLQLSRSLRQPAYAALAVILVLGLSGTGVAYAAEGTLPGDALYGVKVDVIEPIQTALITSPSAKANWKMQLAGRRIDEAAQLAQKGALTPQTEDQLAARVAQDVQSAQTLIKSATSTTDASVTQSAYASRLAAYDSVLSRISSRNDASSTSALRASLSAQIALISPAETARPAWPEPEAIHAHVAAPRMMNALMAPAAITSTATATATITPVQEHSDTDVAQIGLTVQTALANSQTVINENASELDPISSHDALSELARAKTLADRAQELLAQGDQEGAFQAFMEALTTTAQLEVFTHAAATLKVNAFTGVTTSSPEASTTASEASTTAATTSASVPIPPVARGLFKKDGD